MLLTDGQGVPPLDAVNAMISFGNTLLYNDVLKMMKREGVDERLGIIHSINKRLTSLNLDFADIYKPLVVDRSILALISHHQIKNDNFEEKNGGVYLNLIGKKTFAEMYTVTMNRPKTIHGIKTTLATYISKQIKEYKKCVLEDRIWVPGKVY